MTTPTQTINCTCNCIYRKEAERKELLEAVQRAIAGFEPNEKSRVFLHDALRSLLKYNAKPKEINHV